MKTKEYRVTWTIELEAADPQQAAELALLIQRDCDSLATSFVVVEVDPHGRGYNASVKVDVKPCT